MGIGYVEVLKTFFESDYYALQKVQSVLDLVNIARRIEFISTTLFHWWINGKVATDIYEVWNPRFQFLRAECIKKAQNWK